MGDWRKKLFGTKIDYPDAILRDAYPGKAAANIRTGGFLNKLDWDWKDGIEALTELKQPEYPKLAGADYGRAMPSALGFKLPTMGGRREEQEAMTKARREKELRRQMELMGLV